MSNVNSQFGEIPKNSKWRHSSVFIIWRDVDYPVTSVIFLTFSYFEHAVFLSSLRERFDFSIKINKLCFVSSSYDSSIRAFQNRNLFFFSFFKLIRFARNASQREVLRAVLN